MRASHSDRRKASIRHFERRARTAKIIKLSIKPRKQYTKYTVGSPEGNYNCARIGKKAWLFAKLQPGRDRKRINATWPPPFSRAL